MTEPERQTLVSIVLPVYNKEKWITETLQSVVNQSYKNWECVIVDDGSSDNSSAVIQSFISTQPGNWKLIRQPNSGQSNARNTAIANCSGEYVAFLDGDDVWAINKLESQVAILDVNPETVLVLCPFVSFSQSNKKLDLNFFSHRDVKRLLARWIDMRGYGGGTESVGMVRRYALASVGGFNINVSTSAGLLLTLQLADLGKIEFCNTTLMGYRQYPGQWHHDHVELKKNMAFVTNVRCGDNIRQYRNTTRSQNAYFFITSRGKDRSVFENILAGTISVIRMFMNLILRRTVSKIRARKFMKIRNIDSHVLEDFLRQISA